MGIIAKVGILLAVLLSSAAAAGAHAAQQVKAHSPLDDAESAMLGARDFQEAEISPDGNLVAWVESVPAAGGTPSSDCAIYIADLNAPHADPNHGR